MLPAPHTRDGSSSPAEDMDISNLKDHGEGVEGEIRFDVGNPDLTASRIDLEYVYTERTIRVPGTA